LLFAVDRTKQELVLIDTDRATIVGRRHLAAHPDYVRWIDTQRAIWVTQPDAEQIEMFSLAAGATEPTAAGTLAVPGGPESLVLDLGRGKAYTHLWRGKTVRIDLAKRALEATWANGCKGSRGIALDAERQWLFAACAEGGATVLDLEHDGSVLGRVTTARGVDVIAYDPGRRHLYLPSASDGRLTIVGVSKSGSLAVLGSMPGEKGTHCAAADDRGGVWLCDPVHGRLVVIRDPYPATSD
jgi:hypothetical protein